MKNILLSTIAVLSLGALSANAQFVPAAGSALNGGTLGVAGYSQTITATIPTATDVTGQQILDALPAGAGAVVGGSIDPNSTYPVTVTSATLTVAGLPAGLNEDCDGCTVDGGSSQDIVISGTPTAEGSFTVGITSETAGNTTIGGYDIPFGGQFEIPPLPPVSIPTLSGVFDAEGYTLVIANPNGIAESNEVFSLGLYPNPTEGSATLDVNSTVAGLARIEVYSITGALVQTDTEVIRIGANRLTIDFESVPTGIYLVKADINGSTALIRMQKR